MLLSIFIFSIIGFALWSLLTGLFPTVSPKARSAVRARSGKKVSTTTILIEKIAVKIHPLISIEKLERQKLESTLSMLNIPNDPELIHARAWATGLIYGVSALLIVPMFTVLFALLDMDISLSSGLVFGLILGVILTLIGRQAVFRELDREVKERRDAIEWELPQFAGTVLRSLGHTTNVIAILTSYSQICGSYLKPEIDKTLNDMRTGNHEKALENLANRINSGAFTQLVNGLIGLVRGDDQKAYFQIIAKDFSKMQSEQMRQEILKRPEKLTINNILLLAGMMGIFFVAIFSYLMDTSAVFF